MAERHLLQKGTNRFYKWTAALAKRSDMVEVDEANIQVRIKAIKAEIDRKRELISMAKAGSIPEALTESALALKNLQAELAAVDTEYEHVVSGNEVLPEEKDIKDDREAERALLMDTVETDPEILAIRGMKSVNEVADYLALNYGMGFGQEELALMELADIQNRACIKRTGTIQEMIAKG